MSRTSSVRPGPRAYYSSTHTAVANISTPPHTEQSKRPHLPQFTPVRVSDVESRTLLMSPAFSLPQPRLSLEKSPIFGGSLLPPQPPIAMSMVGPVFSTQNAYEQEVAKNSVFEGDLKKKKQKKARREGREVSFLLESSEKPPYSYATLIGMAILSHPAKQLTLSQIYLWISDTFKYYGQGDVGWQNLIRHNLSLNKAFVKGEKSKDGKGHHWLVQEEFQNTFLKAKNNKRSLFEQVMEQLAIFNHGPNSTIPLSPNTLTDEDIPKLDSTADARLAKSHRSNHDVEHGNSGSTKQDALNTELRNRPQLKFGTPRQSIDNSLDVLPVRPILAGKNSPFTLSFSCRLNFEFLPLPPVDSGLLLEPITPRRNLLRPPLGSSGTLMGNGTGHTIAPQLPNLTSGFGSVPPFSSTPIPGLHLSRTPKQTLKTPVRLSKMPVSGTMVRKLWQSPSYLEDFYHSPFGTDRAFLRLYDDDDMILRAFESPASQRKPRPSLLVQLEELKAAETEQSISSSK
ncbi:hypothetical protein METBISCDRAFT_19287 [Metschnikowia bicuspidata]|uniref:Fork-head domain-containing protein n=1 Tax=Metschnikowia bicuspidata TaxID=27322 RepID=A0A4P9Z8Z3_9ASCO|nr:hypothetical protein METBISCDRAFT_19287 [Metschnikowia bicuspidata]